MPEYIRGTETFAQEQKVETGTPEMMYLLTTLLNYTTKAMQS